MCCILREDQNVETHRPRYHAYTNGRESKIFTDECGRNGFEMKEIMHPTTVLVDNYRPRTIDIPIL